MDRSRLLPDVDALAARIPDGAKVAVFKDCGVAMDATRALIRRHACDLHLVTVPTSTFQAELLIAAGCVATIETSGVSMGELGPGHAFVRAVKSGSLRIKDATCPAIYAQIQAGEKGIPFMPIRGLIGSDLMTVRDDWKITQNPFGDDDPVVVLPAIVPDVALFHAPKADRFGNVWVGRQLELRSLAHAAKASYVTVEEVVDDDLSEDEATAAGLISAHYVTGIAVAEKGAWPLAQPGLYDQDDDYLKRYCAAALSEERLAAWMVAEGLAPAAAAE